MENVVQAFKNLYTGNNIVCKHFILLGLLFIPALAAALAININDYFSLYKLLFIFLATVVVMLISIIPTIFLSGYYLDFCKSRLNGDSGLPPVTYETFMNGLKMIPLFIVWSIYASVLGLLFFCILAVPFFYSIKAISNSDIFSFVLLFLTVIFTFVFLYIVLLFIIPFVQYIWINFSKDYKYRSELFNPLSIFKYIAISFKSTAIIILKYILVNIISNVALTIIGYVFMIVLFPISLTYIFFIASGNFYLELLGILIFTVIYTIAMLVYIYIQTIIAYSMVDNLATVYKTEIEPKQNSET